MGQSSELHGRERNPGDTRIFSSFKAAAEEAQRTTDPARFAAALLFILSRPDSGEAGYECAMVLTKRFDSPAAVMAIDRDSNRELLSLLLGRGSNAQIAELKKLAFASDPMKNIPGRIYLGALGCIAEYREGWAADLGHKASSVRLKAIDKIMMTPGAVLLTAGAPEATCAARYILTRYLDDLRTAIGPQLGAVTMRSHNERVQDFFERAACPGVIQVAAEHMSSDLDFSSFAWKTVVEFGDTKQLCAAKTELFAAPGKLVGTIMSLSSAGFRRIEGGLLDVISNGGMSPELRGALIKTFRADRCSENAKGQLAFLLTEVSKSAPIAEGLQSVFSVGVIDGRAVDCACVVLEPHALHTRRLFGLPLYSTTIAAPRPVGAAVTFALSVLEAARDPRREEIYRAALSARSAARGPWLDDPQRVALALVLGPGDPVAARSITELDVKTGVHAGAGRYLQFLGFLPLATALPKLCEVVKSNPHNDERLGAAQSSLLSLWEKNKADEGSQVLIVSALITIGEMFPSLRSIQEGVLAPLYAAMVDDLPLAQGVSVLLHRRFDALEKTAMDEGTRIVIFPEQVAIAPLVGKVPPKFT